MSGRSPGVVGGVREDAARALGEVGRGHQGELVNRQRPDRAPWHDEGDPSHLTGDDLPEEVADSLGIRRAAEGQGAGDGRGRDGSAGDKQDVVRNRAAHKGLGQPASGIDAGQCPERKGRTGRRGEFGELELPHLAEAERLRDSERPIPKVRLGRDQLDADAILRKRPQSQGGLEGRDAAARDHYPRRHVHRLPPSRFDDDNTSIADLTCARRRLHPRAARFGCRLTPISSASTRMPRAADVRRGPRLATSCPTHVSTHAKPATTPPQTQLPQRPVSWRQRQNHTAISVSPDGMHPKTCHGLHAPRNRSKVGRSSIDLMK
jgi:hypothetical protein